MIGDLQQLAPVVKNEEWGLLKREYETVYFFSILGFCVLARDWIDNGDWLGSLNQTVSHCLEFVSLNYFDGNQLRYSKVLEF